MLLQAFETGAITTRLGRWNCGKPEEWDALLPLIYNELRRKAHFQLVQNPHSSFQPTILVHELYLHFREQNNMQWQNRSHFYAVVALAMRRLIVNDVLRKKALKRGGGAEPATTVSNISDTTKDCVDIIDLNNGLSALENEDQQSCRIVELRFFGGLSNDEIANALQITSRTVYRKLAWAKAWLYAYLNPDDSASKSI